MAALTPDVSNHFLQAGPLSLLLVDGQVRSVRFGHREILRRVYVAVRDSTWQTIPGRVDQLTISNDDGGGFVARFQSVHEQGPVRFRWQGTVAANPQGQLTFHMEGQAHSDFAANRIGICVLHPAEALGDVKCVVTTVDGQAARAEFPRLVHPHLLFANVRGLSYEHPGGVDVALTFEGDTFETEDQRQYGDNSFKTYSRPQALPKPFDVQAQTKMEQSLSLRVDQPRGEKGAWSAPVSVAISCSAGALSALPALGFALPSSGPPTDWERRALAALAPAFLRAEVVPARAQLVQELEAAMRDATALGVPLSLAVYLSRAASPELVALADALTALKPNLVSVTIMSLVDDVPAIDVRRLALATLNAALPNVPVGVGVYPYFTELNRNREAVQHADFAAFPLSPQVHLEDDGTWIENIGTVAALAETLASFAPPQCGLAVDRLTLRPVPRVASVGGLLPRQVDGRQSSLLAAGWLVGVLDSLARAKVVQAALFEAWGLLGIVAGGGRGREIDASVVDADVVAPLYHVIADVAELSGQVLAVRVSEPHHVAALVLTEGRRVRVLAANLTRHEIEVVLRDVPGADSPGWLRRLGAAQWEQATEQPEAFRAQSPVRWTGERLMLGPQELIRLDLSA